MARISQLTRTYVTVSLNAKAARRLINQAGGGLMGAFSVLARVTSTLNQAAHTAGLDPSDRLSATEIAAVIRTDHDPKSLASLEATTGARRAGRTCTAATRASRRSALTSLSNHYPGGRRTGLGHCGMAAADRAARAGTPP